MKEMPVIIVQLVHIQGPLKGLIQEFTESEIAIGRHPSCQVQFPTELTSISRQHAEIVREGNRFKIVDRSTNGTFVNGKRITEAFLKEGDVIMFTEGGPKVSYLAKITNAVQVECAGTPPAPEPKPTPKAAKPSLISPKTARPTPEPTPSPLAVKPAEHHRQTVQKVQAPLMVQLGPTLRSYKELPIVMGKKPDCDFVLNYPAISDQHAQIFYSSNQYWVRDLTGRNLITINGRPIGFEASLKPQDIMSLAPHGPALRFLGEGRLAEYEEEPSEEAAMHVKPTKPEPAKKEKPSKSIFDVFKK
jgi:pSer/pThr/pTyr-binding forkhead associated (FHA) protein